MGTNLLSWPVRPLVRTAATAWLLVVASLPVQAQVPANAYSYSKVVSTTYDALGRVQSETVEPDNLPSCVVSTYGYDGWGNRNSTTTANCVGAVPARQQFVSRTSSVDFSASSGLFAGSSLNALGQSASASFDPRFGVRIAATDIAGLQATWQLDDFGRVVLETRPDGTKTATKYCYVPGRIADLSANSAGCADSVPDDAPADAVMYVHQEALDTTAARMGPYGRTYADSLGRTLRTVTEGFDGPNQPASLRGARVVKDVVYSVVGTKVLETQPYYLANGSSTTAGSQDVGLTLTQYDALGRPTTVYTADPRGLGGTQVFGAASGTVSYGSYGSKVAAKTSFTYVGLNTTTVNDKGQQHKEEKNPLGLLVRITDPAGGQLAHQHDAFGNLVATKDALQNSIAIKYDIRGNRTELNDPDAGLIQYDYDALGQVVWQQNANQRAASTSTTMAYDKLGRMITRTEPEGTGSWSYDKYANGSTCPNGVGRLCENSFTRAGTGDLRTTRTYYDSLGRMISDVATVANGPTMATARSYDSATGRLASKTYPTGLTVQYGYTALGYSGQLKLATAATLNPLPATAGGSPGAATTLAAGTVLWQAQVVNAWGRTEQQQWSNGVNVRVGYEAGSGRITTLSAGIGSSTSVLDRSYTWDSLNNLTYRADNIGDAVAGAVTEAFEYADGLSRLTKYTVAAPAIPGGSRAVSLSYNALGMLLNKSDVGAYTYPASGAGAIRPHALQSMAAINAGGTTNYTYDANGNLVSASAGKYRTMAYTSFNLPDSQSGIGGAPAGSSGGTARYTWVYDENHQRIKEVRTIAGGTLEGTRTTWFLHPDNAGNLGFEYEVDAPTTPTTANPTATNARHYLSFGGQTLGVLVSAAALPTIVGGQAAPPVLASIALNKVEYWHKDHLGSLSATTDHNGVVTARYAYDPFGKRRYTNGSYDPFGAIVVDFSPATNSGTDRGFTEHEHLDDIGIIHMNGRLFDPTLGRFLQADRFIQGPKDLQNYNRYSYCLNNPLTCSDPTGLVGWELYSSQMVSDVGFTASPFAWHRDYEDVDLNLFEPQPVRFLQGCWCTPITDDNESEVQTADPVIIVARRQRWYDSLEWYDFVPVIGDAYGVMESLSRGRPGWSLFYGASGVANFASLGVLGTVAKVAAGAGKSTANLALGIFRSMSTGEKVLDPFAKSIGAQTYVQVQGFANVSEKLLTDVMNGAEKISFNLNKFDMGAFEKFLKNPAFSEFNNSVTNWELYKILTTPELLSKTTFYGVDLKVVPPPTLPIIGH